MAYIFDEFIKGYRFYEQKGFVSSFPRFNDFYEGKQWKDITDSTRYLPRPVFNICKKYIDIKTSNILNDLESSIDMGTLKSVWTSVRQSDLNEDFLLDAAVFGTGILHYYLSDGSICGEILDPLSVVFSDPEIKDISKQEYIIIRSIKRDIKTYTKYFKRDGYIYFSVEREGKIIKENILISNLTDFPIVLFNWERRKNSIYGIGEVEMCEPIQRQINWLYAMNILSAQDTAWGKYIVKPGAIRNQKITNEPGQVLVDYSGMDKEGIRLLQPIGINGETLNLIDKINEMSKYSFGVSDFLSGDYYKQNTAQHVLAEQENSKKPLLLLREHFIRKMYEVFNIWLDLTGSQPGDRPPVY